MEETKLKTKSILVLLIFFCFNQNMSIADIYQSSCITVEKKNLIQSASLVFSFNRGSVVINKLNEKKTKIKINISKVLDQNQLIFDAQNEFYVLNFKPNFSYLKKTEKVINNEIKPNNILINDKLNGINLRCTNPKLVKKEDKINVTKNTLNDKNVENILAKLKNNEGIQNEELTKIMQQLNSSGTGTEIKPGQLLELLKSKSLIGRFTSKDTLNKIKSEEFLKVIKDEFNKLVNQ